jgi:hypothetical protein
MLSGSDQHDQSAQAAGASDDKQAHHRAHT